MQGEQLSRLLGENIRRRRVELRLTQQQLAEALGIAQSYLSDLEKGKRNPSISAVAEIADALEVAPSFLLSGAAVAVVA